MTRVLYFAAAQEATSTAEEELDLDGKSLSEVRVLLAERHAALASVLPHCRLALNHKFARDDDVVPADAELGIIPPVAGG